MSFAPRVLRTLRPAVMTAAVAALALVANLTPARANLVIDNFNEVQPGTYAPFVGIIQTTVGSTTTTETGLSTSNVIGGVRESTIYANALADSNSDFVNYIVSPGVSGRISYASTDGATGDLELFYEGSGGVTGLNADLTDGGMLAGIITNFLAFDFANGIPLGVAITLTDTLGNSFTTMQSLVTSGAQSKFFAYSDYIGVDVTSIRDITVFFDAGQSTDFTVQLLAAVPEPSSVALSLIGGFGLIGLAARKRLQRSNA